MTGCLEFEGYLLKESLNCSFSIWLKMYHKWKRYIEFIMQLFKTQKWGQHCTAAEEIWRICQFEAHRVSSGSSSGNPASRWSSSACPLLLLRNLPDGCQGTLKVQQQQMEEGVRRSGHCICHCRDGHSCFGWSGQSPCLSLVLYMP